MVAGTERNPDESSSMTNVLAQKKQGLFNCENWHLSAGRKIVVSLASNFYKLECPISEELVWKRFSIKMSHYMSYFSLLLIAVLLAVSPT